MRVGAYPQGVFISRNLTSDPDTGLGRWSEAEIAAAIRDGRSKDGRVLNIWGMPWAFFHNLTPDDAQAIARYLKTLPAVHNEIPPPLHYGIVETIVAKFWLGASRRCRRAAQRAVQTRWPRLRCRCLGPSRRQLCAKSRHSQPAWRTGKIDPLQTFGQWRGVAFLRLKRAIFEPEQL